MKRYIIFFVFILFLSFTVNAQVDNTSLVGCWRLDDDTLSGDQYNDLSGQDNHGNYYGDPVTGVSAFLQEGMYKDANDGLNINHSTDFNFGTGNFTINFYFNTTATAGFQGVLYKKGSPYWRVYINTGSLWFHMTDGANNCDWYYPISANTNYFVTWLKNSTDCDNMYNVFFNGVRQSGTVNTNQDPGSSDNAVNIKFGTIENEGTGFIGTVDELSIYKRALSSTEISSIYNDGYQCPNFESEGGSPPSQGTLSLTHDMVNTSNIDASEMPYVISYNGSVSNSDDYLFNCTLMNESIGLTTHEVNITTTNGFSFDYEEIEDDFIFSIHCNNSNGINATTGGYLYRVDSVIPELEIITNFVNNSDQLQSNTLSIEYNATDENIYAVNLTWFDTDGSTVLQNFFIDELDGVSYSNTTSYLLSTLGYNYSIRIELWDHHTLKMIPVYKIDYLTNGLEFEDAIKVYGDTVSYAVAYKEIDKYSFDIQFNETKNNVLYFETTGKWTKIPNSKYRGHYVDFENKKWLDLEEYSNVNIKITQESDQLLKVEILDNVKEVAFKSIGDLNYLELTYFYNVISQDTQYLSSIDTTLTNIYEVINMLPVILVWIFITYGAFYLLQKGQLLAGWIVYGFGTIFDLFLSGYFIDTYMSNANTTSYYGYVTALFVVGLSFWFIIRFVVALSYKTRRSV